VKLTEIPRLPLIAGLCVFAALLVVVLSPHGGHAARARSLAVTTVTRTSEVQLSHIRPMTHQVIDQAHHARDLTVGGRHRHAHSAATGGSGLTGTGSSSAGLSLAKAVGQLVISTYDGTTPPPQMLAAVRAGQTGAIILMGDNTAGGIAQTRESVNQLQSASKAGGNPGLLIMTDQEGGEVKRLPGAPDAAAAQMSDPQTAYRQGVLTGKLLRRAGVNLDLAPVADVSRIDGFMTQEQRTFGSNPQTVAKAACSFALGLQDSGVGYTMKHFPGLGDAVNTTDGEPVSITESAADIYADDLAYRECANGPYAAVMVSSASYKNLTGATPAVLSPSVYHDLMPADNIHTLTMSDSFESGAIENLSAPAMTAINAGLDMVMYPGYESASAQSYPTLLADAQRGALSQSRVQAAAAEVLAFKRNLGLQAR
jgi:beta-N-acetylhexosaminidase